MASPVVSWSPSHTLLPESSTVLLDHISAHSSKLAILPNVQCPTNAHSLKSQLLTQLFVSFYDLAASHSTKLLFLFIPPPLTYKYQVVHCKTLLMKDTMPFHSNTSLFFDWYSDQLLWIVLTNTVLFPWNALPSSISKIYLSFKAHLKYYYLQELLPIHLH